MIALCFIISSTKQYQQKSAHFRGSHHLIFCAETASTRKQEIKNNYYIVYILVQVGILQIYLT